MYCCSLRMSICSTFQHSVTEGNGCTHAHIPVSGDSLPHLVLYRNLSVLTHEIYHTAIYSNYFICRWETAVLWPAPSESFCRTPGMHSLPVLSSSTEWSSCWQSRWVNLAYEHKTLTSLLRTKEEPLDNEKKVYMTHRRESRAVSQCDATTFL